MGIKDAQIFKITEDSFKCLDSTESQINAIQMKIEGLLKVESHTKETIAELGIAIYTLKSLSKLFVIEKYLKIKD